MRGISVVAAALIAVASLGCGKDDGGGSKGSVSPESDPEPESTSVKGYMLENAWKRKVGWEDDVTGGFRNPYGNVVDGKKVPNDMGPWVFENLPPECDPSAPSQQSGLYRLWIQSRGGSVYLQGRQRHEVKAIGDVITIKHHHAAFGGGTKCDDPTVSTRWIPVEFPGQPWPKSGIAAEGGGGLPAAESARKLVRDHCNAHKTDANCQRGAAFVDDSITEVEECGQDIREAGAGKAKFESGCPAGGLIGNLELIDGAWRVTSVEHYEGGC